MKPRSLEEVKATADKFNPAVGKYFVRSSKWNGRVVTSKRGKNGKNPACYIEVELKDCPDEAIAEGIILSGSGYDFWVEALREINRELNLYDSDLKFATRLLRVPMAWRTEWLYAKTRKKLETIEQTLKVMGLLDKLTWEALNDGL